MFQLFLGDTYFAITLRGNIFVQDNSKTWYVRRWWSICHWIYPILLHLFANLQRRPWLISHWNIPILKNTKLNLFRRNVTPGPGPVPVIVRQFNFQNLPEQTPVTFLVSLMCNLHLPVSLFSEGRIPMPIWDSISLSNWDGWNSATAEGHVQAEGSHKLGQNKLNENRSRPARSGFTGGKLF